jgi:hypothetical protein
MTQSTARPLLTWEDGPHASYRGSAGGIELFSINRNAQRAGPRWFLRCELPGMTYIPGDRDGDDDDEDTLKDQAEDMLARWLAQAGAVTPARLIEAAARIWGPVRGRDNIRLMTRLITTAAGMKASATVEVFDAIADAAADLEPQPGTGQETGT